MRRARDLVAAGVLIAIACVGILGRGIYTPDEPREADLAWRMSWQTDKSVPLLAGEAFCEKPPLTYWLAAIPISRFGMHGWSARLPNLLYAALTALGVALLARRAAGAAAAWPGAIAISTFLLAYQVSIWLATDAPLLAAVAVALLGSYLGFHAPDRRRRLLGYLIMHAALAMGFLAKSAAAWMVPALALATLIVWERRWRELWRWELHVGLLIQAAVILVWVRWVYLGDEGAEHLKVFFWNNLVGRFTHLDAPAELQYASGHRNTPGKYLVELPLYLAPWTLLVAAAVRRAWLERRAAGATPPAVRFALAASLPPLALLSLAATARNVYLAPALPGMALLLAWWSVRAARDGDAWDGRALKATAILLLLGTLMTAAAVVVAGREAWSSMGWESRVPYVVGAGAGLLLAARWALRAWRVPPPALGPAQAALFLAYAALLIGPVAALYSRADAWQDLAAVGRAIRADASDRPLILFAPDETTRAMIDLYTRTSVELVPGPVDADGVRLLKARVQSLPGSRVAVLERRDGIGWLGEAGLAVVERYSLPHGRTYVLLAAPALSGP